MLFKDFKSLINKSFSLVIFSTAIWIFGLSMLKLSTNLDAVFIWAKIYYLASAFIALFLLYFCVYFPYSRPIKLIFKIITIVPFLFIIFVILHPTLLIKEILLQDWGNDPNEQIIGHIIFLIYFVSYMIASFCILVKKYFKATGIIKFQLKYITISTFIAIIFGSFFDLILPILDIYKFYWIGPLFTVILVLIITYLLFYKPSKTI